MFVDSLVDYDIGNWPSNGYVTHICGYENALEISIGVNKAFPIEIIDDEPSRLSNEWVEGKWYNADGSQTYDGTLSWMCDENGWWVEDSSGWYPYSQWVKIDRKWYYFTSSGYMDYGEYHFNEAGYID